jgi:cytochrome c6
MRWLLGIVLVGLVVFPMRPVAAAADGTQLFKQNCAGCHLNGGNIIRRSKTLKLQALESNGFHGSVEIVQIVTMGKGNMSAYGDRLTPEDIQSVSSYVWDQAQVNWKKP